MPDVCPAATPLVGAGDSALALLACTMEMEGELERGLGGRGGWKPPGTPVEEELEAGKRGGRLNLN